MTVKSYLEFMNNRSILLTLAPDLSYRKANIELSGARKVPQTTGKTINLDATADSRVRFNDLLAADHVLFPQFLKVLRSDKNTE